MTILALLTIVALLLIFSRLPSRSSTDATEVREIRAANFDAVVSGGHYTLIEFYSEWCPYCIDFAPTYHKFGSYVMQDAKLKGRLVVAKVHGPHETALKARFQVTGYPSILLLGPNGEAPVRMKGHRSFDALLNFVTKNMKEVDAAGKTSQNP